MRYRLLVVFCSVALPRWLERLLARSCRTVLAVRGEANLPNARIGGRIAIRPYIGLELGRLFRCARNDGEN